MLKPRFPSKSVYHRNLDFAVMIVGFLFCLYAKIVYVHSSKHCHQEQHTILTYP